MVSTSWEDASPVDPTWDGLFSVSVASGILNKSGLAKNLWVTPQALDPSPAFYLALAKATGATLREGGRPPLFLSAENGQRFSVEGVTSFFFPGGVQIARLKVDVGLRSEGGAPAMSMAQIDNVLRPFRQPKTDDVLRRLICEVMNLSSGRRDDVSSADLRTTFAMSIAPSASPAEIDAVLRDCAADLVGLLTGSAPDRLRKSVVDAVVASVAQLNEKVMGDVLLINRQGLLSLKAAKDRRSAHTARFEKSSALLLLATFARDFFRDSANFSRAYPETADRIAARLRQWIEHPAVAFDESFSQSASWSVLLREFLLAERLKAWASLRSPELESFRVGGALHQRDPWDAVSLAEAMGLERRF